MKVGLAFLLLLTAPQQQKNPPPKIDAAKVEAATKAGVQYLRGQVGKKAGRTPEAGGLVLLTLVHAGVRKGDALFDELLKGLLEETLETTYRVSIQAMALEEIDRAAHQKRLFQCAQFLVDNQCANGQWSYGSPTYYPEPEPEPDYEAPSEEPKPGEKPPVRQKFRVRKQRDARDHGDNSNAQFAALGLRACHDAGIILPPEVVRKAALWWREGQCEARGEGRGWNYGPKGNPPYGSMTAGAVAALAICDRLLGVDGTKDVDLAAGLHWLRDNYSVTENPGRNHQHHHYYLWGLERACDATGTGMLGRADWYFEGASVLLATQGGDGSWKKNPLDTCYAILFLKRATRPLVDPRARDKRK